MTYQRPKPVIPAAWRVGLPQVLRECDRNRTEGFRIVRRQALGTCATLLRTKPSVTRMGAAMEDAVIATLGNPEGRPAESLPAKGPPGANVAAPVTRTVTQVPTREPGVAWMPPEGAPVRTAQDATGLSLHARYKDLGLLGRGGTAEVRRVQDNELGRTMAMKILHPGLLTRHESVARFVEEARATARLQHPGIVPVHDLGCLPDGRWYFTLKEIAGRTLGSVVAEVHGAIRDERWEPSASGWTFRRLLEVFHRVCETVAYAHIRGVLHRDLKPSNVMVGEFGEVLVLDWGLAKVRESNAELSSGGQEPPERLHDHDSVFMTQAGQIMGTPAYMSPEQARGEAFGPTSDVYALGAILHEILFGQPAYSGTDALTVLRQVLLGTPTPPGLTPGLDADRVPSELRALCQRAMSRDPAERPSDAGELARTVQAWLAGEQRRTEALQIVARADAMKPEMELLRQHAEALRREALALRQEVAAFESVERKLPAWRKEDAAEELGREYDLRVLRYVQTLSSALNHEPDLPEAHERLANHYRAEHVLAEAARDGRAAARYETLLRAHDRSGLSAAYLKGEGALTLWTEPPGAEVDLYHYVPRERRLVPEWVRGLGRTPLINLSLPMGSYLLVLRAEGRAPVRYPVHIQRQAHWDGIRPGSKYSLPIYLPMQGELGPDDLYVPASSFLAGGDPLAAGYPLSSQSLWVDGFVMRRFPVTNAEYLVYLNELVASGHEAQALQHAPRERSTRPNEPGALVYARDPQGRFLLGQDAEGETWMPDWPVMMVDWNAASAYARWMAVRTGEPWRLPGELEWEKAARGVDGRLYPWGDALDATWCCMRDTRPGLPHIAPVGAYPVDESPFLIRDMAGNVGEWCLDLFRREGPPVHAGLYVPAAPEGDAPSAIPRGGNWYMDPSLLRLASRIETLSSIRDSSIGFRLARPLVAARPNAGAGY